jgi:hypothetical protein
MRKKAVSMLLAAALLLVMAPLGAFAASERKPIYIGYADVDYMAEEVLKQIPTAGKSPREQIKAVYDWIIWNCDRDEWDGTCYFDENEVSIQAGGAFYEKTAAQLEAGEIVIRQELESQAGTNSGGGLFLSYDSNSYIASFAYDMMATHTGNCAHYSALLAVLLGHLGYDCRLIPGEFINRNGSQVEHKWNYVLLDDGYYWLDVRMDHSSYASTGKIPYTYFLQKDADSWAKRHAWDQQYSNWLAANPGKVRESYAEAAVIAAAGPWGRCSKWAKDAMARAGEMGLIPDALAGQDLTKSITRQEFAAVAVNFYEAMTGKSAPYANSPFTDTNDSDVARAHELGVVNGLGGGLFGPDRTLTREEAATMLGRVCELAQTGAVEDGISLGGGTMNFSDNAAIGQYARPYVSYFVAGGMVKGMEDGRFAPKDAMTREQALKVALETVEQAGAGR